MANGITVKVKKDNRGVVVSAPYIPEFPPDAKARGGRWDPAEKVWIFDPRDEEAVRELLRKHYGTDGDDAPVLVGIRVELDQLGVGGKRIWHFAGRLIAERPGRDSQVRFGPGVVVVEGGFGKSGGSHKHPALSHFPGTVIEIRDVPLPLAERLAAEKPGVSIVQQRPADAQERLKELVARRDHLKKELDLIEEQIKMLTEIGGGIDNEI
ncbi:MAG: hypothetical protein H5U02_00520 [Clostridia bacterium]|nr:hypothetical protein [Clostridia bacterium]